MESIVEMILCTGNPNGITVASAVKKIMPGCDFASRASGYDFNTSQGMELFRNTISKYNVFINSSYIADGVQQTLLDLACIQWMAADIKGLVITLGSTIENNCTDQHQEYRNSKLQLRYRSLELNEQTGVTGVRTSYVVVGGINHGQKDQENYLDLDSIASTIQWVTNNPNRISLLQIESSHYKFQ